MRVPLAVDLESRDGTVSRDPIMRNAMLESRGQDTPPLLVKRPGMSDLGQVHSGTGQLLFNWNGVKAIIGDTIYSGTINTIISGPTSSALSPTNAGLTSWSASRTNDNASTPYMMFKNRSQAWTINRAGTVTAITFASNMGAGTYTVSSLTRVSTTATAVVNDPTAIFNVGDSVTVAGAGQAAYNGTVTITAVTTGVPAKNIPITITRAAGSSTATAVSQGAHGLTNGSTYTISGADQPGFNGSYAVTVVDSKTFTYTATTSNRDIPITITRSGTTATATTADGSAHNLATGTYTILNANESAYNGSVSVTVLNSTQFTYQVTVTAFQSPATGSPALSTQTKTASGSCFNDAATPSYNAFTAITSSPHGYATGDSAVVSDLNDSRINGTYTITVTDTTHFTFTTTGFSAAALFNSMRVSVTRTPPSVSSITASSGRGTCTTSSAHKLFPGLAVTITGATPDAYNGTFVPNITSTTTFTYGVVTTDSPRSPATGEPVVRDTVGNPVSPSTGAPVVTNPAVNPTFSYAVAGSPTTPATGTITAQGNGGMVPGIPYIDGYFSVMDTSGVIWSSNADDPTTWGSLVFITARQENGAGKALGKSGKYLVAFKEYSTEYYYDAQNATGSPFSPVDNGFRRVGCASGDSVAHVGDTICWLSQEREGSRSVHRLDGLEINEIATPHIARIVKLDNLSTVYSYGLEVGGHRFYVLTLVSSGITLAYDLTSGTWAQWTTLTPNSAWPGQNSNPALTFLARNTATDPVTRFVAENLTTTSTAMNLVDGSIVNNPELAAYIGGGIFVLRNVMVDKVNGRVTAEVDFDWDANGAGASVLLGLSSGTAYDYTESYFKYTKAMTLGGSVYLLHESNGHIVQMQNAQFRDAVAGTTTPIHVFARTARLDGGDDNRKKLQKVRMIADRVLANAFLRYSDDDAQTFSNWRTVDLSGEPAEIRKCGAFRRRNIEMQHVDNTPLRTEGLELFVGK